ncbi:hypothetical protein QVD17_01996 [Tagetes erecta]|uniref:LIM zinc-binding domain-containing protein n=1 Tax=Tagetes erecta TaxID=13708 RepID=A0AAD8P7C6_TARER|nr:hypothetical protein QVD17_01996 [Tagetes erecta]
MGEEQDHESNKDVAMETESKSTHESEATSQAEVTILSMVEKPPPEKANPPGGGNDDGGLEIIITEKRLALIKAWEENEKTRADNKAYTKMSAIGAWENTKRAAIEADLKQIEEDIEIEKAKQREKMKNKIAALHKEAEEKRADTLAKRGQDIIKVEEAAAKITERTKRFAMSREKCMVCDETVDDEDELSFAVDGDWYHNECFKCSQCDEQLLQKTSSKLSSIFFKTQSKRIASKLPPLEKRQVQQASSNANAEAFYVDPVISPDQTTIMNLFMHNPELHGLLTGISTQTEIEPQDILRNTLEQLTQNPEMMNAINQLGQQMDGNQDLGSLFAAMSCSDGGGDLDMSLMFQQMMPFVSQAASSRLHEHNRPMKRDLHRRCYSDTASLSGYSIDCQMNIKEAAQKIADEYSALDIFSSMVESAALLNDNVYDVYGLADLCSEEELAEDFMVMLKRDVCRRLGKRYDCCSSVS